ncbi:MAG: DUF2259 domain-containing protein [Treponema sp.]|jgi:predicted secreted protein|nr:DUF2259 domain-containing protein [Treponema sp.]
MAEHTCSWFRKQILGDKKHLFYSTGLLRGIIIAVVFYWGGSCLWAGDMASFVDLGFSSDGKTYMFAQYGVQEKTLCPWADLFVVDVPNNAFVSGGRVSFVHDSPVKAGQDGSGALYRIISRNTALADRYGINYLLLGQALYLSLNGVDVGVSGEIIEFRDFEPEITYKAQLVPTTEGSGNDLKSSFFITLERTHKDRSRILYTVGSPQVKRSRISSYRIKKVIAGPQYNSLIFVIEMRKQGDNGIDIRYMVEAVIL